MNAPLIAELRQIARNSFSYTEATMRRPELKKALAAHVCSRAADSLEAERPARIDAGRAKDEADLALQRIGTSLGTQDEWTDQGSMIADVERAVAELLAAKERAEAKVTCEHCAEVVIAMREDIARLASALAGAREECAKALDAKAVKYEENDGSAFETGFQAGIMCAAATVRGLPTTEPAKAEEPER